MLSKIFKQARCDISNISNPFLLLTVSIAMLFFAVAVGVAIFCGYFVARFCIDLLPILPFFVYYAVWMYFFLYIFFNKFFKDEELNLEKERCNNDKNRTDTITNGGSNNQS